MQISKSLCLKQAYKKHKYQTAKSEEQEKRLIFFSTLLFSTNVNIDSGFRIPT